MRHCCANCALLVMTIYRLGAAMCAGKVRRIMPYNFKPGMRVQLKPHTDLWMQGARYGEIRFDGSKPRVGYYRVKMDSPKVRTLQSFAADDIEPSDIANYRRALREASDEVLTLDRE